MENRIVLVRSSRVLIERGYVGYGWEGIKFEKYSSVKELLTEGFKNKNIGRRRKQIIRFFELKKGDIVVVPVSGAIAIGIVEGTKNYKENSEISFSANRVKVDFYKDKDGKVLYVPRVELETALERRLKIRMSIADLENFRDKIQPIILALDKGEIYTWNSEIINREELAKNIFIEKFGDRLRSEKGIGIAAGGQGLEELILEIFQAKGCDASIPAKNSRQAGEDVDIIARKESEFGSGGEVYLIQAKHHRGKTNMQGLNQLVNYDPDEGDDNMTIYKILMTTAKDFTTGLEEEAIKKKIIVLKGEEFVKWIYENMGLLSSKTLKQLGISDVPTLI